MTTPAALGGLQAFGSVLGGLEQARAARYQASVARRQAAIDRINAEIARENRRTLLTTFGEQLEDLGVEAAGVFARNEVDRSASGFSVNSRAYERHRRFNRSRLAESLQRLGSEFTQRDQDLLHQEFGYEYSASTRLASARHLSGSAPLLFAAGAIRGAPGFITALGGASTNPARNG